MPEQTLSYTRAFSEDPNKGKPGSSWVKLLPLDETIEYDGRSIEFTSEYLSDLVAETRRLNAYFDAKARERGGEAYRQPIWREHRRETERDGSVDDIKMADKASFAGVWVKLTRTADAQDAIDKGKIKYVSAGIVPEYTVESGETFGPVIREVSLTADPFLKSIGTIQDTLEVELSHAAQKRADRIGLTTEALTTLAHLEEGDMEELIAKLDALTERLDRHETLLQTLTEDGEDDEPEVDASDEDDQVEEVTGDDADETPETEEVEEADEPGALAASMLKFSQTLQAIDERLDKLEKMPPVRLNTTERGRQGDPETPEDVALSYEDRIAGIMRRQKCTRLEAVELEMKQ